MHETDGDRRARLGEIRESVRDWVGTVPHEWEAWPGRVRFLLSELERVEQQLAVERQLTVGRAAYDMLREERDAARAEVAELRREAEKLEADNARLREALEHIAEGNGCSSRYGPGCDTHCKTLARAALAGEKP